MLRTIIKKEIQNNIFSFRFIIAFVLLVVIVPVTILILTDDYVRRMDEYSQRQNSVEQYLKNYAHFNRIGTILVPSQPPLPFQMLIRGLNPDDFILENVFGEFNKDSLPVMFPLVDLTFIVTILLSLIALVFSYDSICGEKEDGTLKLMLANPLSRAKLILGKIVGGMLTLFIPFFISLIIALLIIHLNPRVSWSGANWGTFGFILLGAILYVGFFYSFGVFISARHNSSSASIMTLLFAWVLMVLVIPNLSPYIASFLVPTPSQIKVGREVDRLTSEERDELGRKLSKERQQELQKLYPVLIERLSEADTKERIAKDPEYRKAYEALSKETQAAWDEANRIQSEKANTIRQDLQRREEAQTRLSIIISAISPLADFLYLSRDLSSTGIQNLIHFDRISRIWGQAFNDYERQKLAALQKQNPTEDWWNTPVDMSDRPRFIYYEEALASKIKSSLPVFAVLIIYSLIFFAFAYFSFIRYDVR